MPVQEPVAGPVPGTVWMVVSVRHDDVLNVRSAPGVGAAVVGTLDPTEHDVVALGSASLIDRSIWWEIDAGGVTGWSNARYLGAMGMTTDTTSDVVATLGSIPSAGTMEELAQIVVAARWPELGGDDVVVVVDAGGVSGDIGEISLDVLPAEGDDSVRGERLVVFGQRDGGAGPFSLMAGEVTMICWRGADPSGLCV
jgi:uncharacterized protein YraI